MCAHKIEGNFKNELMKMLFSEWLLRKSILHVWGFFKSIFMPFSIYLYSDKERNNQEPKIVKQLWGYLHTTCCQSVIPINAQKLFRILSPASVTSLPEGN